MRRFLVRAAALGVLLAGLTGVSGATAATGPVPLAPADLTGSVANTGISLSWRQPAGGPAVASFRVYEGGVVVRRTATTSAPMQYIGVNTTHTYTVTAVSATGVESAQSAPFTGTTWTPGMAPQCTEPAPTTVFDVTSSALSVRWTVGRSSPLLALSVNGRDHGIVSGTSLRVGGLTPDTSYAVALRRVGCGSQEPTVGYATTRTLPGTTNTTAAPRDLVVTGRSDRSIALAWSGPADGSYVHQYAIYDGAYRVATSWTRSATVTGLFHGTGHRFTVAALNVAGNESEHSPVLSPSTEPCPAQPPAPARVSASAVTASTVRLDWTLESTATSYTVLDGNTVVATVTEPAAVLTGLASASTHQLRVVGLLTGCTDTPASAPVTVTTLPGAADRPAAPAGFQAGRATIADGYYADIPLSWSTSAGLTYRLYDGATVVGTYPAGAVTLRTRGAERHVYRLTAVNANGDESAPSGPVEVITPFLVAP
ncbi:fibronectin type III domain-containing protein [Dactylosporangium sp. CA-152071]|uniref:fibronectin type III domain-containing protein n=1 Tax=Dactylosporangium sp. CA-152071 TaxID=3239933 RepID=UPI003D90BC55